MAKVDMKKTDYYKSGNHKINVDIAREKAIEQNQLNKLKRIEEYDKKPNVCKKCCKPIPYEKKNNNFCCRSCSASFNNVGRMKSTETKNKIGLANTRRSPFKGVKKSVVKQYTIECKICKKQTLVGWKQKNNKTCGSDDCKIMASVGLRSYQNGSRKPVWFFNPYENKEVLLESSWEVEIAEYLISKKIEWKRPTFIKWVDSNNKTRRYFPDFYLPTYDRYLDPKNPYCMKRDEEKLKIISSMVDIIYGDKEMIKETINRFPPY